MIDLKSPGKNGAAKNSLRKTAKKPAENKDADAKPSKTETIPELTAEEKEAAALAEKVAAEMIRVEKSNAARLKQFGSSRSMDEKRRFKVVSKHPSIAKGDTCAVVGCLEHKELSNGYKTREAGLKAAEELNKQYFN